MAKNKVICTENNIDYSSIRKAMCSGARTVDETIELVKQSGSTEIQDKVEKNLNRLQALGDKYNSAEGVVFMYKGHLMKLTGSFAAVNQILGTRFDVEKLNK